MREIDWCLGQVKRRGSSQSFRYAKVAVPPKSSTRATTYIYNDKHILQVHFVLIDFSLTVKAATFIFISGRGLVISSSKQGKSGSIYNLVKK